MEETTVKKKSEKQIDIEMKKLKAFLVAVIPNDYDKYDLKSKFDSSLTYLENKDAIIEDLKQLYSTEYRGATIKEQAEQTKNIQERMNRERNKAVEAEIEKYNGQRVYSENKELDEYYSGVTRAVNKIAQGYSNLAFVKGRGGIGKSWNIKKALIQSKAKFHEIAGDVTEAYLYRMLYEHNGDILWFKDVARLLSGQKSINLLKAATETESERVISRQSYSKQQDDLPTQFIYRGKIIFDYNEIVGLTLKDDFEALTTRGDFVDLALSVDDIKNIMRLRARATEEKEVTEFLIQHYEFTGHNLLNLRTQVHAFDTYKYAQDNNLNWKDELKKELQSSISKARGMLYSLIGTRAVRTTELTKLLLKYSIVGTARTANRRINDYLVMEDLYKVSAEDRDFFICLKPLDIDIQQQQKTIDQ